MKFTKTYEDAAVKYYESENGKYKIIERKSGCTVKGDFSIFNIMGTTLAETKTLEQAIQLFA